jgi:hypothetical protein
MVRGDVVVEPTTNINATIYLRSARDIERHYVGEVGAIIMVKIGDTIIGARRANLFIRKPDGTEDEWEGAVIQDEYIQYVTILGDLDQAGKYLVQPYVEAPSWAGYTTLTNMTIYNVFDS